MTLSLAKIVVLAGLGLSGFIASASSPLSSAPRWAADPPSRSDRPEIAVLSRGEGTPVVLRWRPTAEQSEVVQVGTRTVPSVIESPGLEDPDADVRLAGFMRPPIEKLFTLQGRVSRVAKGTDNDASSADRLEIRWRVMDSAARLFGIRCPPPPPTPPTPPDTRPP
jgi:hypothetical protein